MKYDLSKPESLPLALGVHIIVDTRTGATFEGKGHQAWQGLGQALKAMTDVELSDPDTKLAEQFGLEAAEQIKNFAMSVFFGMVLGDRVELSKFVDQPNRLIQVGPFVTWDECLHNKHSELMAQRMERFAASNGNVVNHPQAIDREIAQQMRTDIVEQRAEHDKAKASSSQDPMEAIMAEIFGGGFGLRKGR